MYSPLRRYAAECLGTAGLLCAVIGSGIMGENLAGGNVAIALLANTLATVFALFVLIEVFGPISGAHFNPAVSLAMWLTGQLGRLDFAAYVTVQLIGAALGAWVAHAMFDLEILQTASKVRTGPSQWLAEVVATTGLLLVIFRMRKEAVAMGSRFTLGPLIGSLRALHLQTPLPYSAACYRTPLQASGPLTRWAFLWRNCWALPLRWV